MKFRIVEKDGVFYPQVRDAFFWWLPWGEPSPDLNKARRLIDLQMENQRREREKKERAARYKGGRVVWRDRAD